MPVVLLPSTPLTARTALQLIRDGLGLTNCVGTDQTLTNDETSDCLRVLNDLIEDWNTQEFAVYGLGNQTFNTIANQATYTVGAGANWVTNRPVRINEPAYATVSGVTFPYFSITQQQYDLINYKSQPGGGTDTVQNYLYVNEYPLGLITLWPVPNSIIPITFSMDLLISSVPTAATVLQFPPGYMKAFKYELGCELPSVFGKTLSKYPEVVATRNRIIGNIKRANMVPQVLQYDISLLNSPSNGYPDYP